VPLCGYQASRSGSLPAEPIKVAVSAEIEAGPEETPQTIFSAVTPAPEIETVVETETEKTEIAQKKTQKSAIT